jgi:hypothetical protein
MQIPDTEITTRAELSELIRSIKAAIAAGTLRQAAGADGSGPRLDFSRLETDGPWPDVIEAEFDDASGARFRIEVETYHGAGGRWKRR